MRSEFKILTQNLKFLRSANNISQEKIALSMHTSRSTYSSYESGGKFPDIYTLNALSTLYDIDLETLVTCSLSDKPAVFLNGFLFSCKQKDSDLADILKSYEALSQLSKNIVMERLNATLEYERRLYTGYYKLHKYHHK